MDTRHNRRVQMSLDQEMKLIEGPLDYTPNQPFPRPWALTELCNQFLLTSDFFMLLKIIVY